PHTISTPTTPLSPAPEPFHIRILNKSDEEAVVEHLRKTFFKDEPLNVDLKITEDGYPQDLEKYSVKSIGEGNSLVAITDSGNIVGVCLNGTIYKNYDEEDNVSDPKFSKVVKLLDAVEEKADTFGKFPDLDKYLCIKIISVDGTWRGKGIAKLLVEKAM
ncbi:dopamine N-acetyltransferase-like, partial [Agrilus planipennis]|uniref:Dopamine N-acetyltransferase-like n=1 Tax=Agrilus planipennis TaxID=224129 RepID=A0A1W4XRL5_AGRPL